ncbi:MAG TPA: LLM class flavin-dependent oxidoreductase [Acidimicrobiia bacterium]|nr:LLM class flavin-dependent oxidoreductase [Acidimicrobiia bacterium]
MTDLGVSLGWSHREPVDRMIRLVKEAEAGGVSACWVIDSQIAMRDAYALLALCAHATDSIHLGPGVTNLVTRHETVVANSLVTLRALAPGRILAGVGAGDSAVYSIGLEPQPVRELERGIQRLRSLLAGVPMDEDAVRLAGNEGPAEPIFVAASQPRMLRLAGASADGVIIMGPADPDVLRSQMVFVEEGARSRGRDHRDVFRDVWVTMAVDGDEPGVDAVRSWASAQARWLTKWERLPPSLRGFEAEMQAAAKLYDFNRHLSVSAGHADVVSDELAASLAIVGDVEGCASRLRDLSEIGADRITVSLLSGGRERRLEDLLRVWSVTGVSAARTAPGER